MSESGLDEARATVMIHDRIFQKYSIDNTIYCVPVDEVRANGHVTQISLAGSAVAQAIQAAEKVTLTWSRTKGRDYTSNTALSRIFSEAGFISQGFIIQEEYWIVATDVDPGRLLWQRNMKNAKYVQISHTPSFGLSNFVSKEIQRCARCRKYTDAF
jgi:hypothetical protein